MALFRIVLGNVLMAVTSQEVTSTMGVSSTDRAAWERDAGML